MFTGVGCDGIIEHPFVFVKGYFSLFFISAISQISLVLLKRAAQFFDICGKRKHIACEFILKSNIASKIPLAP